MKKSFLQSLKKKIIYLYSLESEVLCEFTNPEPNTAQTMIIASIVL